MKTLIKLLVAAAVFNAAARYGLSAWTHYAFRDSVEQMLLFGADSSPRELVEAIVAEAERQDVAIDRDSIELERQQNVDRVTATYVDAIELFPRYVYPRTWDFSVEVRHLGTAGMTGGARRP